jgi:hypothetical protein
MSAILFILAAAALIAGSFGVYCRLKYIAELKEFRANLKVGQLVRLRMLNGTTVPARIIAKNSETHLVAEEIDNKKPRLTASHFIYP